MSFQPAATKLAGKIARVAYNIHGKESNVFTNGATQKSRSVILHAAALIVLKALNFRLPTKIIDQLFTLLDSISYIRIDDYRELDINELMVSRIRKLADRKTIAEVFKIWQCKRRSSSEQDNLIPQNLKRALLYFQNWKAYRSGFRVGSDHQELKSQTILLWRGLLKEGKLLASLHSLKLLSPNTKASIVKLKAFDQWKDALDCRRRGREHVTKLKGRYFGQWKSFHVMYKTRDKTAGLISAMTRYKLCYSIWMKKAIRAQKLDKLGVVAWYQRLVGDSFVLWKQRASVVILERRLLVSWHRRAKTHTAREEKGVLMCASRLKLHAFKKWIGLARANLVMTTRAAELLEKALSSTRKQCFNQWRELGDGRVRKSRLACSICNNQLKIRILKLWTRSSALQKIADEHLRGNLWVKGLYWWRAAVANRIDQRSLKIDSLGRWLRASRSRRSTRFFLGQVMLKSIGKYQPSSKALSILLPSPALSPTIPLPRSKFDEVRNRARCFYLWINKTRKARRSRQLAIEYRKTKFAKWLHKWRSLSMLRNSARNEPYNTRRLYYRQWMARCRISSTLISRADRKLQVHRLLDNRIGIQGQQGVYIGVQIFQALGAMFSGAQDGRAFVRPKFGTFSVH